MRENSLLDKVQEELIASKTGGAGRDRPLMVLANEVDREIEKLKNRLEMIDKAIEDMVSDIRFLFKELSSMEKHIETLGNEINSLRYAIEMK